MKILKNNVVTACIYIIVIIGVTILGSYNVKDLSEAKKAEETINNLIELRVALEKYYQISKSYPDLTREGVKDNLKLLDYRNSKGELISFATIYGRNTIPSTKANGELLESNAVYDSTTLNKINQGGWSYDFSGRTGEIHANLPENIYSQGINWSEY